jgi:hypothetical protein
MSIESEYLSLSMSEVTHDDALDKAQELETLFSEYADNVYTSYVFGDGGFRVNIIWEHLEPINLVHGPMLADVEGLKQFHEQCTEANVQIVGNSLKSFAVVGRKYTNLVEFIFDNDLGTTYDIEEDSSGIAVQLNQSEE